MLLMLSELKQLSRNLKAGVMICLSETQASKNTQVLDPVVTPRHQHKELGAGQLLLTTLLFLSYPLFTGVRSLLYV